MFKRMKTKKKKKANDEAHLGFFGEDALAEDAPLQLELANHSLGDVALAGMPEIEELLVVLRGAVVGCPFGEVVSEIRKMMSMKNGKAEAAAPDVSVRREAAPVDAFEEIVAQQRVTRVGKKNAITKSGWDQGVLDTA